MLHVYQLYLFISVLYTYFPRMYGTIMNVFIPSCMCYNASYILVHYGSSVWLCEASVLPILRCYICYYSDHQLKYHVQCYFVALVTIAVGA
jgi:hypothetical protein